MVLTGSKIRSLMRQHRVVMRDIKSRHGITLKRIREVRANGVSGFMAQDWFHIITGRWPDEPALAPVPAPVSEDAQPGGVPALPTNPTATQKLPP